MHSHVILQDKWKDTASSVCSSALRPVSLSAPIFCGKSSTLQHQQAAKPLHVFVQKSSDYYYYYIASLIFFGNLLIFSYGLTKWQLSVTSPISQWINIELIMEIFSTACFISHLTDLNRLSQTFRNNPWQDEIRQSLEDAQTYLYGLEVIWYLLQPLKWRR